MRFYQRYSFNEYLFGAQTVLFVVTDNYSELFQSGGTETDIFLLDSSKKDLNTEEGSFAIDELGFSVNQAACSVDDDSNALFFALECKERNNSRYCAVFLLGVGEEPSIDNMDFIGKLTDKVSSDDIVWHCGEYEAEINAVREYKFTALSFDMSMLDDCKLEGDVYKVEGGSEVRINNVYERITDTEINEIFAPASFCHIDICEMNDTHVLKHYFKRLGNLYTLLNLILSKATEIIYETTGNNTVFTLAESPLGIQGCPVRYRDAYNNLVPGDHYFDGNLIINNNLVYDLYLTDTETATKRAVLINWKLFNPALGHPAGTEESDSEDKRDLRTQISNEKEFSFRKFENVSELLFAIARAFGCYIFPAYSVVDGNLVISLQFKSRSELLEPEITEIISATDGSIDTSSVVSKEVQQYYSTANNIAADGCDIIGFISGSNQYQLGPTRQFEKNDKSRNKNKEDNNEEQQRLILSTSPTLCGSALYFPRASKLPMNLYTEGNKPPMLSYFIERLHSAIYIKTEIPEAWQNYIIPDLMSPPPSFAYRPVAKVYARVGGEALKDSAGIDGDTLTNYVNAVMGRDKRYYETEYSITVPFWNGFRKIIDGITTTSWKNLKLGSQILIKETIRKYENGQWTDYTDPVGNLFAVVSIERNYQKPETKIKLYLSECYAYGLYYEGEALPESGSLVMPPELSEFLGQPEYRTFTVAAGEAIAEGDAFMLLENGTIIKARSEKEYAGKTAGIAKQSGTGGDTITGQISGRAQSNSYSFSSIGKQVFARTNDSSSNITQTILAEPTTTEDMIICLGRADSETSFVIDIKEFPFESGTLPES